MCSWDRLQQLPHDPRKDKGIKKNKNEADLVEILSAMTRLLVMQQREEGEESETEARGQMRQADEKRYAPSYLTDLDDNRH